MKEKNSYKKLSEDISVDVAIVGGGLVGIDTAYLLSQSDVSVAVLEAKKVGSGATSKTTAFLTQVIDTDYTELVKLYKTSGAKLVWESHGAAIDEIERIVKKEKINCGFMRVNNYEYVNDESQLKHIEEEYRALQKIGANVKLLQKSKLPFTNFGHLEFKKQAKYSASQFIEALGQRAASSGAQIYENTEVTKISGNGPFRINAAGQVVKAKKLIIATYDPFGNPKETRFKKGMYVSYVFEAEIPKGALPYAIYEDVENPYHYFRVDKGGKHDTMIIGGEDHRKEIPIDPDKNYKALKEYISETFPHLKVKIKSRWIGPILEPSDGLAFIGEYKPNRYIAYGFSGNGMTYSIIAAMIFRDQILGKKNKWAKLYNPNRPMKIKRLAQKALDYGEELIGGAVKNLFE